MLCIEVDDGTAAVGDEDILPLLGFVLKSVVLQPELDVPSDADDSLLLYLSTDRGALLGDRGGVLVVAWPFGRGPVTSDTGRKA